MPMQWRGFFGGALTVGLAGLLLFWFLLSGGRVGGARPPIIIKGGSLHVYSTLVPQSGGPPYSYFVSNETSHWLWVSVKSLDPSTLKNSGHLWVNSTKITLYCASGNPDGYAKVYAGDQGTLVEADRELTSTGDDDWSYYCDVNKTIQPDVTSIEINDKAIAKTKGLKFWIFE
jgi:hypothetical protein